MPTNKDPIRIVLMGAMGRMGQRISDLASRDPRFQVVAGVERADSGAIGRFLSDGKAPVVAQLSEVLPKCDVVIDFTAPEATMRTVGLIAARHVALVVGTTGLTPRQIVKLKTASRRAPIVFSPNMSIGVNVLFELVKKAAQSLPNFDIEIVEAHHNLKKDSPSGTALKLAEIAAQSSGRSQKDFVYGRQGLVGARPKKEIGIMSIRGGDIVGDHTVFLSSTGERLELTHRAQSRDSLALGALTAAAWVFKKRPGLYSMLDVLKMK